MKLPKIRKNLLVQELSDEVLIYDQSTHKSFCLNETAKKVFNACDGKKSFSDLSLPEDIIYLSLDELKKQDLIDDYVSPFAGMNRREVIRKVGLASMIALPVISAMVAPSAINAASPTCTTALPSGQGTCPASQRCVSGNCTACVAQGQPVPGGCVSNSVRICCNSSCTTNGNVCL